MNSNSDNFIRKNFKDLALIKNMSNEQLKFLLVNQSAFTTIFNFFMNIAIAFLFFRKHDIIPRAGFNGFLFDLFFCILLTAVVNAMDAANRIKKAVLKDKIKPMQCFESESGIIKYFSKRIFIRAIQMGLVSSVILSTFLFSILMLSNTTHIQLLSYALIKGIIAASVAFSNTFFVSLHGLYHKYETSTNTAFKI